jgi:hypothetical protein
MKKLLIARVLSLFVLMLGLNVAFAQTNISGDIAGTITDSTGAAVPNAVVTVTNVQRGQVKSATSNASGQYRVSLLSPGDYEVQVSAQNFEKTSEKVTVSAAVVRTVDLKLAIGNQATTIEVSAEAGLLHTDDAQLSTSFSYEQVQSLPNPGNDLTFVAQTAPGSVMNTQGGYGNFSSFGLPATSNTFTVNGGYENDPFLNVNNSGATNLLLGNNDISTVTVIAPAYSAAFGGLAGAQVAEISRSGSNTVHGNLQYFWNGSSMNANDWFNNNSGTPKSFSNSNQWAASIGGPIKKDKMFFFINTEGLRVIIPVRSTIYAPSPLWQAAVLSPTPSNGSPDNPDTDPTNLTPYGNLAANGSLSQAPLYQTMFNYFNNAPGASAAIPSLSGDPRFVQFNGQGSNFAEEWIITGRFDWNPTNNDKFNVHYKQDKGVQPTQTNLLSPLFNANSPQPSYEGQAGWTRSIGANITNQFVLAGSYYRAIFANTNQAEATASVPFVLLPEDADWGNNPFGTATVGGANYAFPQGRLVTQYQFIDDLTISKGRHTLSFGFAMRRDDVTDYTPSEHVVPEDVVVDTNDFSAGFVDEFVQRFPQRLTQPLATYTMGTYAQDQWKATPQLTLTAGIRFEHNSNPTCLTNCFSNLSSTFSGLPVTTTTPYNQLFASGRHQAFLSQQVLAVNPRIGFAFVPGASGKTTIRGGFGMFTDSFPAQIASDLDTNPPAVARFTVLGLGVGGNPYTFDPTRPDSAAVAASISNHAFQAAYPNGGSYSSILAATGGIFRRPAFIATAPKVFTPTTEEWSLAIERQLDSKTVVSASYVGNHSYHGPVLNAGVNAYSGSGAVDGLPTTIPNGSLGATSIYESANQSNYNGIVLGATRRSEILTLQFNYAYSHSLDLVSNGGFNAFGVNPEGQVNPYNLSQNYGNADYNVKNYISASYIINIPAPKGPKILVGGWEVAGTVFHSSGLPFTVTDGGTVPSNYGGTLFADQLSNNFSHTCGGEAHAGAAATPCAFAAFTGTGDDATYNNFASATGFGSQGRNSINGPAYTDTDLTLTKTFAIPFREARFKLGAQFFNILNHPNFAQPNFDVSSGPGTLGVITSTVSTPTSILGSFLGGDASPRLIQLVGKFTF